MLSVGKSAVAEPIRLNPFATERRQQQTRNLYFVRGSFRARRGLAQMVREGGPARRR
jgi:hypothetical protein